MATFRFADLPLRAKASFLAHAFKAVTQQHHRWMRPLFERFLGPDGVAIDVGGHSGQYAKLFASIATRGRVWTFEPSGYSRSILGLAIRCRGLDTITPVAKGLGDAPGTLVLTTPLKAAGTFRFGVSHMGGDGAEAGPAFREEVEVTTIDAFASAEGVSRLDLVKIDVEGWEVRVLEGGAETFRTFRPALYLELVDSQLARAGDDLDAAWRLLGSWNYRPFLCRDAKTLTPLDAPTEGDIFWLPD